MLKQFLKYSANGNNFILFDAMGELGLLELSSKQIQDLCEVKFGIGADGVMVLSKTKSPGANFDFKLYNSDGGEAEMCGNAARIAGAYMFEKHFPTKTHLTLKAMNAQYPIEKKGDRFWIQMSETHQMPELTLGDLPDTLSSQVKTLFTLDTGVPHLVIEVKSGKFLKELNLLEVAPFLRFHKKFPKGSNVDFISLENFSTQHKIQLRVFERGVENETWSCGTGIAAVAWAVKKNYSSLIKKDQELIITTPGGEHKVKWDQEDRLWLSGEITKVFEGYLT